MQTADLSVLPLPQSRAGRYVFAYSCIAVVAAAVFYLSRPTDYDRDFSGLQRILAHDALQPLGVVDVGIARRIVSKYSADIEKAATKDTEKYLELAATGNDIARIAAVHQIEGLSQVDRLLIADLISGSGNQFVKPALSPESVSEALAVYDVTLPKVLRTLVERKAQWRRALRREDGYSLVQFGTGPSSLIQLVRDSTLNMGANHFPQRDTIVSLPMTDAQIVTDALSKDS